MRKAEIMQEFNDHGMLSVLELLTEHDTYTEFKNHVLTYYTSVEEWITLFYELYSFNTGENVASMMKDLIKEYYNHFVLNEIKCIDCGAFQSWKGTWMFNSIVKDADNYFLICTNFEWNDY